MKNAKEEVVVIYVKEGCPYCQKVKYHIKNNMKGEKNIKIYVAEKDFSKENFKNKYGEGATFPRGYNVSNEGEVVRLIGKEGGSDDIIEYLG